MESEGKFKTHVTIGDEFIQIEHVDIPNSMTKDRYQIMTIGSDTVLTIEGTKEPLWLVFDGNQLRFELSQADAMKVSVPMITMLKFRRIEDS